ncbi:hypothetical protein Sgly_1112 [Syntrophobotulus glycolicus DSM 8271]|uniref:Uncharacterized protein n=1 Tax=Syntrophobotulus glycolicus (strain DSM 8271 / FlGlyR) TaxID=645991 RepID=F0SU54_SYNGF|nr:(2Fe-2S)-binding protein [Syntrophobotulus glycolicus]ADY55437.1 hypothetical protein Sgly_1112 [Syntrophobotulus glycolicus DSM 8271]
MRIINHPILGQLSLKQTVTIWADGEKLTALQGETIASALLANGRHILRHTARYGQPRGIFCAIGRCTDCVMTVNGSPNVRTCVTEVQEGMVITSNFAGQRGDTADE